MPFDKIVKATVRHGFLEDGTCPDCGGHAVKHTNKKSGGIFYGCSNFPECTNLESKLGRALLFSWEDHLKILYDIYLDEKFIAQ